MKGILKSGKIINGRLAEIFVSRGIAREIKEEVVEINYIDTASETKEAVVIKEKSKRVRRTKAQIERENKKK